jgi:hypothetical protein
MCTFHFNRFCQAVCFEELVNHNVSITPHEDICGEVSFRIYREKYREKAAGIVTRDSIF